MNSSLLRSVVSFCSVAAISLLLAQTVAAQTLTAGDPGANVNIVGPTPDPADIRDFGLKQQNEPSCAIRPGDADCIICGFNDYRTVDVPGIADAWQGVAMSCDAGTTWTSRIAPGHPLHPAPIGTEFAADPRMIALPGIAVFNFIGGDRDQNNGVLAIQHWLEINKEDADFYEPGKFTYIADTGSSGRFIDKPDAVFLPDKAQQQGTITLSTVMENEALGTIQRDVPTGKLFVAFAVFTGSEGSGSGSQSVKVLVKDSDNLGQTWQNQVVKLSEDQNVVSGISLTAMGDSVLAVWRRAGDNNDPDSIMYAYTNNRGKKWTKAEVLADICRFDQISATTATAVTFRTNDFPWAANDGKNFYVFYSDRNFDGTANCTGGRPRIVMKHAGALSGLGSSAVTVLDDSAPPGSFQFMPAATAANGKLQVAWYDTRREDIPAGSPAVIADYFDPASGAQINRKVDVFTARVISDASGGNVQVSAPVRVSQFRIGARIEGPPGEQTAGSIAIEGEASFSNAKLYASGFLSFIGDYISVGARQFRVDENGKIISNASPVVSPTADSSEFFIAWTSNRDVRGNIFDPTSLENTVPYSPPENTQADTENDDGAVAPKLQAPHERPEKPMLADASAAPGELDGVTRTTEGIEDPFDPMPDVCIPGVAQDRTRDSNIYGSRIRDRARLTAPTPTKPLTNLQRSFPIALSNVNDVSQTYLLRITRQPADFPSLGRASFRQLPAVPPFDQDVPPPVIWEELTVPAKSTFARTLFLVSNLPNAVTGVQVFAQGCDADDPPQNFGPYQGSCAPSSSISLGGEGPSGPLQQPNYQSPVCDPLDTTCTDDVLQAELHNPELINPELINPELINPELINPELINPELINPELINPELINPELINLGFANPELINPELINPELINPELINPELINPELINPELINSSFDDGGTVTLDEGLTWTDYTYIVRNTGNVTTSYNADITLAGAAVDDVDSQLVAWTLYITPTSRDCSYKPQVERRVLGVVNNPDDELASEELEVATIDEPFNGEISAIAAPGQALFFTRRVFGTAEELENISVSGFTTASQAANCSQTDRPPGNSDPYFCQLTLADERERILLDTQPPEFGGLMDGDVIPIPFIQADRPGGACVDLVGSGIVTASDNGEPVPVSCTDSLGAAICTSSEPGQSIPVITLANPNPAPIVCTAVDDAGNVGTVSLFVDVQDTQPPVFLDFPTATIELDADAGSGTASLDFEAGLTAADVDNVDPFPVISCTATTGQISGEPLPVGLTTIDCTVSDASGNMTTQSYGVQVNDVTPPEFINIPLPDFEVDATGPAGATVTYVVPDAADAGSGVTSVVCVPPPGTVFAIGVTSVTCTATDASGNSASASFDVTVSDDVAPAISAPTGPIIVEQQDPAGAVANFTVTATDVADPAPAIDCTPPSGSVFPPGLTTVTCTATDASGNAASASFDVSVSDTVPPILTVPAGGFDATITSAAGAIVDFSAAVTATDAADPAPGIICVPPSGSLFAPGATNVSCTATDSAGNSASASFDVRVGYASGFGIDPKKLNVRGGSSNPLSWGWLDSNGAILDTSYDPQVLEFRECNSSMPMFTLAGDPGSSGFRIKADNSWEYNWQSDGASGAPLDPGFYCVRVTSQLTGQFLDSPQIRVR